jgi:glycosyltransferase involved in cell wall biosynthesis
MWEQYRVQTQRLEALRRFDRIVVVSAHMRDEYIAHGFAPGRVTVIPYVSASPRTEVGAEGAMRGDASVAADRTRAHRLLFIGRMDRLKGGDLLLAALPEAARALDRSLHLTFVGDGPERRRWEFAARRAQRDGRVTVEFAGFLPRPAVAAHLDRADLLVVPSLWPEPFGRVGPEAGEHGVPAVAFDVGGVREWLDDGQSGVLAPGDPATAAGLSAAIVGALADPATRSRLSEGARRMAARFTNARHLEALVPLLEEVRDSRRATAAVESASG